MVVSRTTNYLLKLDSWMQVYGNLRKKQKLPSHGYSCAGQPAIPMQPLLHSTNPKVTKILKGLKSFVFIKTNFE